MSRLTLRNSVAALAVLTSMGAMALGGAAIAQNAAPAAEAQQALPEALAALNLSDVDTRTGRRGTKVTGTTADGVEIEAMLAADGTLMGAHSDGEAALPQSLVEALLPQALRGNAALADIAAITGVGTREGMTMVMGKDSEGQAIRAGFAEDGQLMHFGRGDQMRGKGGMGHDGERGMGRGGDRDGGKRQGRMGDHGGKHERGMKGERGGKGGDCDRMGGKQDGQRGMGGMQGQRGMQGMGGQQQDMGGMQGQGMGQAPALSPEAVMQALNDAGYTQVGTVTSNGRAVMAEAVNKAGDAVTVVLNPRGQVMREMPR